jgi:hypothetical protein
MEMIRTAYGTYVPLLTQKQWGIVTHALRVAAERFDEHHEVFKQEEEKANREGMDGYAVVMMRTKRQFGAQAQESRDLADWIEDHV